MKINKRISTTAGADGYLETIKDECKRWEYTFRNLEKVITELEICMKILIPKFKVTSAELTENLSLYVRTNQKDYDMDVYLKICGFIEPKIYGKINFTGNTLHLLTSKDGVAVSFINPKHSIPKIKIN